MNKKVSTILTASLLMMAPVFGSNIFAQDTSIDDATDKTAYALMPTYWWNSVDKEFTKKGSTEYVGYNAKDKEFFITNDAKQRCLFYVNKQKDAMGDVIAYEFVLVEDSSVKLTVGGASTFALGENPNVKNDGTLDHFTLEWATDGVEYQIADDGGKTYPRDIVAHKRSGDENYAQLFALDKVEDADASGELNKLFNEKGFNLKVKPELKDIEVSGNLFEGSRIWQYTLATGYNVTEQTENGETLTFPAGTYFFAERVLKDEYDGSTTITEDDIDWLNSTFIAVSPTDAGEATDGDRKAGKGFKLTTVKGSEFLFDTNNPSEMQGTDIAVTNACFKVQTNHTGEYPFAISVEKFFYQPSKASMETAEQETAAIWLGVISYDEASQNVASIPVTLDSTDPTKDEAIDFAQHIFGFSDSAVIDGITLLNEDKTPAVYTIKFVGGNEADEDLMDKYLTVGTDGTDFQWEAKGAAIYDETYPIFQYVITKAEKKTGSDKYTLVTFTNRETGENFTAELFPEEGTDRYSLAITSTELDNVIPFTVNRSTYAVEPQDQDTTTPTTIDGITVDEDVIVELKKVTPDEYAGFLNVDNESIRTLAFARDKNVTSNKLYAVVEAKYDNGSFDYYTLNEKDKFATEVYDAAQWQLVKSEKPTTISRVFAYNNTTTKSVDFVSAGDKVSAYTYSLRYVVDGSETDWFLQSASNTALSDAVKLSKVANVEDAEDITNTALKFYIKQNVDGSVTLFNKYGSDNTFSGSKVAPEDKRASVDVVCTTNSDGSYSYNYQNSNNRPFIYTSESEALNIKTYLDPQHAELSWEEAGHVTIESELGNYVSMNDDRDGIVVNEADADAYYLHITDENAVVPSFFISLGKGGNDALSERMYMFNPIDSVDYYVADGTYDKKYQWSEEDVKAIFKSGSLNATADTMTITVKGEGEKKIALKADNNDKNVWGGLNRFKFQIVETEDGDAYYYIRQPKANADENTTWYLYNINDKLAWTSARSKALTFNIESIDAPTANEGVSATEVKVIAVDGSINIKNAAGKNVVVSTILGQIVANEVLTSDNATISVPAGIAIVSVDGEEAVKVSVR